MRRLLSLVSLCFSIILLTACAPQRFYHYTPPEGPPSKCIASCKVASNSCMQFCAMKNSTCRDEIQEKATMRFNVYKSQCNAKGVPVTKTFEKFSRTSSCAHSCNCIPAYNTCYNACGGKVS